MHIAKRVAITSLAVAASLPAIAWALSELVVYYEWFSTGATSRAELGEDFGLGVLLFLVVPPGTLIGVVFIGLAVWSRTGKSTNHDRRLG
jgi:hypothetical protein